MQGGEALTTNNRMELMAAISALEALTRPSEMTIVTDSAYVKNGITEWIAGVEAQGLAHRRRAARSRMSSFGSGLTPAQARHKVTWRWIKGHAGHAENERADALARAGMAPFKPRHGLTGRARTLLVGPMRWTMPRSLVFALTGALAASRSQLDIVGFIFIACLTAVGGGTLRDLILNRRGVLGRRPRRFCWRAPSRRSLVFFTAHLLESRYRALLWLDACALAVAVPPGVGRRAGGRAGLADRSGHGE